HSRALLGKASVMRYQRTAVNAQIISAIALHNETVLCCFRRRNLGGCVIDSGTREVFREIQLAGNNVNVFAELTFVTSAAKLVLFGWPGAIKINIRKLAKGSSDLPLRDPVR